MFKLGFTTLGEPISDITPAPIADGNISSLFGDYVYYTIQITGITQPIILRLEETNILNGNTYVKNDGPINPTGTYNGVDPTTNGFTLIAFPQTVSVQNNDYLTFGCEYTGTSDFGQFSILNQSNGDAFLARISSQVQDV